MMVDIVFTRLYEWLTSTYNHHHPWGRLLGLTEQEGQLVECRGNADVVVPTATHHATCLQVVEHGYERVPEATDIVKHDGLVVIAYGMSSRHREHLVERTYSARQCHHHVAMSQQQVLAVAQVVARDVNRQVFGHAPTLLDDAGHDAYQVALRTILGTLGTGKRIGQTAHQPHVASAKHDAVPMFAAPASQLSRAFKVFGADIVVSRAENTYVHCITRKFQT